MKIIIMRMIKMMMMKMITKKMIIMMMTRYTDTFIDWDPLLVGVGPSNPWMTDDTEYWTINKPM